MLRYFLSKILLLLLSTQLYSVSLNEKEITWLKSLKTPLKIGITSIPNQVIHDRYSKGFAIDIFKKIEHQLNIKFKLVYLDSWNEVMMAGDSREIDIIFLAQKTEERLKLYDFTDTLLILQNKIISNKKVSNLKIEDLFSERVALVENSAIFDYIEHYFPKIIIVPCKTEVETLKLIANGFANYTISESVRASHYIEKDEVEGLLIIGEIDYDYNLRMASRNDFPILSIILSKAVDNISVEERESLLLKWGYTKDKEIFFDKERLVKIALLIFVISSLLIYLYQLNRKLKSSEKELKWLNYTLEDRVKLEIEKNKEKTLLLLQKSRLAQMGEILNMIAHQWRQPLNTLLLINEMLVHKYRQNIMTEKEMDIFHKESTLQIKQMSGTIDDFRDFFHPRKEKSTFLVNDTIEHLILIVSSIFRASDIEILFEEEEDLYVNGYPNELAQAMLSILNNAKDAFMQNDIFNRKVIITLTQKNKQVIITIEDNAGGIPTNIMDKIFEPYFSTKKQLNGTGIGLYMSKMIIEKHMDGSLLVENSKKGATFTIVLSVE